MAKIKIKTPTKMTVPKYNLRIRNPPQLAENQTSGTPDSKSPMNAVHKCDLCGLHFLQAARLNAHIISNHQQKRKTVSVTYGNITPNILDLKKKCKSCGKSFSRAVTLNEHIHKIHGTHKDYKCEHCGKIFSQAGNLKKHIVHDGHKNYKCEFCDKLYSRKDHLKRHVRTVHGGNKH